MILFFLVYLLFLDIFPDPLLKNATTPPSEKESRRWINLPVVTIRRPYPDTDIRESGLVTGSAVISIDYFKRFLAILRNLFGGRVRSYESLVDRARREAILRMKDMAGERRADLIINFRLETSTIGRSANKKGQVGQCRSTGLRYCDHTS